MSSVQDPVKLDVLSQLMLQLQWFKLDRPDQNFALRKLGTVRRNRLEIHNLSLSIIHSHQLTDQAWQITSASLLPSCRPYPFFGKVVEQGNFGINTDAHHGVAARHGNGIPQAQAPTCLYSMKTCAASYCCKHTMVVRQ